MPRTFVERLQEMKQEYAKLDKKFARLVDSRVIEAIALGHNTYSKICKFVLREIHTIMDTAPIYTQVHIHRRLQDFSQHRVVNMGTGWHGSITYTLTPQTRHYLQSFDRGDENDLVSLLAATERQDTPPAREETRIRRG